MRNILLVLLSFLFVCGPSYGLTAESITLNTLEKAAGWQLARCHLVSPKNT